MKPNHPTQEERKYMFYKEVVMHSHEYEHQANVE